MHTGSADIPFRAWSKKQSLRFLVHLLHLGLASSHCAMDKQMLRYQTSSTSSPSLSSICMPCNQSMICSQLLVFASDIHVWLDRSPRCRADGMSWVTAFSQWIHSGRLSFGINLRRVTELGCLCPFISQLVASMDDRHCYLLMEAQLARLPYLVRAAIGVSVSPLRMSVAPNFPSSVNTG
jgi:hypothetical protein